MSIFCSVIIPVYNGELFLREALNCLAEQEPFDGEFEVIATDDGSTDSSMTILAEEQTKGRFPLKVISGARRGNWVASTNKAMNEANGEFIVFLHQDDKYHPARLKKLYEASKKYPTCNFFVNTTDFIDSKGKKLGTWRPALKPGLLSPAECIPPLMIQDSFSVPGVMFRKTVLTTEGFLDENYKYTADWEFWLRLASKHGVCFVTDTLSYFRVHFGSQTVSIAGNQKVMRQNLDDVLERYLPVLLEILPENRKARYRRITRLSVEMNLFLGAVGSGVKPPWRDIFKALFACNPIEWFIYLRYSGVISRVLARIRAGFAQRNIFGKRSK